tara:strand:- start:21882 stop:22418 length:537 start_codon:yes stop_codon:yes gene_type:complete
VTETQVPSFAAAASSMTGDNGGGLNGDVLMIPVVFVVCGGGRGVGALGVDRRSVARFEMSHLDDGMPATVSPASWKERWYRYTLPPSATTANVFLPSLHFAARNAPSSVTTEGDRQTPPKRLNPRQISTESEVTNATHSAFKSRSNATTEASHRTAGLTSAVGHPTANIAPTSVRSPE